MQTDRPVGGRLSILAAALVVARRDFLAVLFSRSFFFFLLGPLFPIMVASLAGGIGQAVRSEADHPVVGVAMSAADTTRMIAAQQYLAQRAPNLPDLIPVPQAQGSGTFNPANALIDNRANFGAIVSGTPANPVLTGPPDRVKDWRGPISLIATEALGEGARTYPPVAINPVATSRADERHGRILTAQAGQTLLFLLTMLLAGMVMSNLVEEKANKIIEILAAAIPLEALFLGKLFAMLGVSLVGIATWSAAGLSYALISGKTLALLTAPAVGWTPFILLGVIYFSMAYLVLGSMFLTIGAMATTVRDVQTLSMPVTMLQLLIFFFASYAMAMPGSTVELAAIAIPLSSPYAMLARAAQDPQLWIHASALVWQALCVALFIRLGATLFKRKVMKSGPARASGRKRRWRRRHSDNPLLTRR
jgi:ABC-2 type transport system permease protein